MARLEALPIELLHLIAGYVTADTNDPANAPYKIPNPIDYLGKSTSPGSIGCVCDLAALLLTNRHFHQVFDTLLYQWVRDHGGYAVCWAVLNSAFRTLEKALSSGFDIDNEVASLRHQFGQWVFLGSTRPLELAINEGRPDVVKWLLEHGACTDSESAILVDPYRTGDTNLRASEMDTATLCQAIYGLSTYNAEIVMMLIDHGALLYFAEDDEDTDELRLACTALHVAVRQRRLEVLEKLLSDGSIKIDATDSNGLTPLDLAASISDSMTPVINMLLKYGAEAFFGPLDFAIEKGHMDNVLLLIQVIADSMSPESISNADSDEEPRSAAHGWSHLFLYEVIACLDNRFREGDSWRHSCNPEDARTILAKLVELGADFNNPPGPWYDLGGVHEPLLSYAMTLGYWCTFDDQPVVLDTLLRLGADPLVKMSDGRTVFNVSCLDWLNRETLSSPYAIALLAEAGCRMDDRDAVTGLTAFESAANECDLPPDLDNPIWRKDVDWLLQCASPKNLDSSHIYEVLDSRLDDIQSHLNSCIVIMRHGWISDKAKSFALEWMISYVTGICVEESALGLSETVAKFNRRAANFFPSVLDRQQLDKLWKEALASRRAGLEEGRQGPSKCPLRNFKTVPWLRINVERDSSATLDGLLTFGFADPQIDEDDEDASCEEPRRQSNLMRAIHRGHRRAAGKLVWYGLNTPRASFLNCNHHPNADETANLCRICPYGQTSACEVAFAQGELEIFAQMWDWPPWSLREKKLEMRWWNTDLFDMPRVYSHGNVMAEWLQLKLGMTDWTALKMTGEHACWMRQEIRDRLAKLQAEVCEIRDAWQARAKISDEMRGHAPYR